MIKIVNDDEPPIWVTEGPPLEEDERDTAPASTPKPKSNVVQMPGTRPVINPADWQGKPIPVREWVVADWLPCRVVSMVSGEGGAGKSTMLLQLAVACATDDLWFGLKVKPCKVLIVACEDEPDELMRRLNAILINNNLQFENIPDIRIIPGVGYDNIMVDFSDTSGRGKRTEFCEMVHRNAVDFGAELVLLDSLHDFFDGNENSRPQARQFVNHLRDIAIDTNGSVVVLAHPSVSGIASGDGRSGSTGWGNTVRSRIYVTQPEEADANYLLLKNNKSNYGPAGGEIKVEYRGGCFHALNTTANTDPVYAQVLADDAFLQCLRTCKKQGRTVSDSKHGSYAPKVFQTMKSTNKGYSVSDFERAMARLFDNGKIQKAEPLGANRHKVKAIIEVVSGSVSNENQDEL